MARNRTRPRRDAPDEDFDADVLAATVAMLRERLLSRTGVPEEPIVPPQVRAAEMLANAANRIAAHEAMRALNGGRPRARTVDALPRALRASLPEPLGLPAPVANPRIAAEMIVRK